MPISLDGSHQMTFQFEIFPIDPQFSFNFYPYEVTDKSNRMSIQFAFNWTNLSNPNFNSASYMIKPQQWNRVSILIKVKLIRNCNFDNTNILYNCLDICNDFQTWRPEWHGDICVYFNHYSILSNLSNS